MQVDATSNVADSARARARFLSLSCIVKCKWPNGIGIEIGMGNTQLRDIYIYGRYIVIYIE